MIVIIKQTAPNIDPNPVKLPRKTDFIFKAFLSEEMPEMSAPNWQVNLILV